MTHIDLAYQPLVTRPCRSTGRHDPMPETYTAHMEYAAQLLQTGWSQHRCPACGAWALWRPDEPNVQPPMLPAPPDGSGYETAWQIPPDGQPCEACENERECPKVTGAVAR